MTKIVLFLESDKMWFNEVLSGFMIKPDYAIYMIDSINNLYQLRSSRKPFNTVVVSVDSLKMNMSDNDVIGVLATLRRDMPDIGIVCVLNREESYIYTELVKNGINRIIRKPYTVDSLVVEMEREHEMNNTNPVSSMNNPNINLDKYNYMNQPSPYEESSSINHYQNESFDPNIGRGMTGARNVEEGFNNNPNDYSRMQMQQEEGLQIEGLHRVGEIDGEMNNRVASAQEQTRSEKLIKIPKNTVLAIHCPKGGVGKSSVSKELAAAYALSTVNGKPLRVLIIDMDVQYGDIATYLNLTPTLNITTLIRAIRQKEKEGNVSFTAEELDEYYLLKHHTGLRVLAAPSRVQDVPYVDKDAVIKVLDVVKDHFDIIVIDTGNDTKDCTIVSIEKADHVILIGNMESATLTEIAQLRKTLTQVGLSTEKFKLVMNETKKRDSKEKFMEIADKVGFRYFDRIPLVDYLKDKNNHGDLLMCGQDNEFTIAIKQIANKILPVVTKTDKKKAQKKKGFFKKIFKK